MDERHNFLAERKIKTPLGISSCALNGSSYDFIDDSSRINCILMVATNHQMIVMAIFIAHNESSNDDNGDSRLK